MTSCAYMTRVTIMVLTLACGNFLSNPAGATSLAAHPISQEAGSKEAPKDEVVKKYLATCRAKPAKQAECDAVKKKPLTFFKRICLRWAPLRIQHISRSYLTCSMPRSPNCGLPPPTPSA